MPNNNTYGLQVQSSNAALSAAFKIDSYPTLLVICNGDVTLAERYGQHRRRTWCLAAQDIGSSLVRRI